jgi:hypothetical protein
MPEQAKKKSDAGDDPPSYSEATAISDHTMYCILQAALMVPFLVALTLLILITYSGDSLRPDLCVLRIALPSEVYNALFSAGETFTNSTYVKRDVTAGWLSLGVWGWCLRDIDAVK